MRQAFLLPKEFLADPGFAARVWDEVESSRYTRWLARRHYENFHVVSFLLPRALHQDFYNVYAFCRWADDLADEIGDPAESLRLLRWWRHELERMYQGQCLHPVFVALRATVERHALPQQPFADLIHAFEQDQTVTSYEDWDELLAYCRYSANPVGRLVLGLCGYRDLERQHLSDATCTALQLANFWQDVSVDLAKGRIYLPRQVLTRHGSSYGDIRSLNATPGFRGAMEEAVDLARSFFQQGRPLVRMVNWRLALDVDLFSRGGLCILEKIRRQDYDVLGRRPVVSSFDRIRLLAGSLAGLPGRRAL